MTHLLSRAARTGSTQGIDGCAGRGRTLSVEHCGNHISRVSGRLVCGEQLGNRENSSTSKRGNLNIGWFFKNHVMFKEFVDI
jgi:hypothetical protein